MDIATLEGLIGNLGFSLVACCAMGFFIWKILEKFFVFSSNVASTLQEVTETNRMVVETNKDLTQTNKDISATNKILAENYKEDMGTMKRDIQEIKEVVKR